MMNIKLMIQIAIGATGYVTWAIMAYLDSTLRADFLKFNVAMAVGTIGLVLRDMQGAPLPPPATTVEPAAAPPASSAPVSSAAPALPAPAQQQ